MLGGVRRRDGWQREASRPSVRGKRGVRDFFQRLDRIFGISVGCIVIYGLAWLWLDNWHHASRDAKILKKNGAEVTACFPVVYAGSLGPLRGAARPNEKIRKKTRCAAH